LKICFFCSEYPPVPHGGAGTFTQVTARALVKAGHHVRVVGLYDGRIDAAGHEDDQGVSVWRLRVPQYRGGWVAGRFELYRLVKNWIRDGAVDLVDAPDHEGPFFAWPRLGAPLVLRAGGSYSYFLHELGKPIPLKTFQVERLSYARADAWIAKSEYIGAATKRLFHLTKGPHATLYNPVDAPASTLPFESRSTTNVVFTGTLTAKKGVISLIDAWPSVRARVSCAELHIFGKDGISPERTSMKEYLHARLPHDAQGSVHFHGHVSRTRIAAALASARAAVFPSYAEGFAWAPLEAMAAGCPTIYTQAGSGPELITDGQDGLLVDPGDPATIAHALCRLLEDSDTAQRLGEAGRRRILDKFSLDQLLPANERFYRNVITSFRDSWRSGDDRPGDRPT
jgi:glycosyltransferase involved in cell wall biosynthesis